MNFLKITSLIPSVALLACLCLTAHAQDTSSAEELFDISFDQEERDQMRGDLDNNLKAYQALHQYPIDNGIPPALIFNQVPVGFQLDTEQAPIEWGIDQEVELPADRHPTSSKEHV